MADRLGGVTLDWNDALPIYEEAFEKVTSALTGAGFTIRRVSPVGSFLRRDPQCRDLDMLIEIVGTPTGSAEERFSDKTSAGIRKSMLTLLSETKHMIEPIFEKPLTTGLAIHGIFHEIQVDVFLCTPDSWVGSYTIWAGDRVHNMFKFGKARAKGLTIWPWGVVNNETKEVVHFDEVKDLLSHIDIDETNVSMWSWRRDEVRREAAKKSRQKRSASRGSQGEDRG